MLSPSAFKSDAGSVSAELAITLPALLVLLSVCMWAVQLAGAQVRLEDAAGMAARAAARGEPVTSIAAMLGGGDLQTRQEGDFSCATATRTVGGPVGIQVVKLRAESCALAEPGIR